MNPPLLCERELVWLQYGEIVAGRFLARPNRFIAHVEVGGEVVTAHVRNTGRCRELLVPSCTVYLEHAPAVHRKTAYSLVAVEKGVRLINMDSQAPNRVVEEALCSGWRPPHAGVISEVRREVRYGDSRLDFGFVCDGRPAFMEVKGVTLEEEGRALFPDAPTERGVKHLRHLAQACREGYLAFAVFVVQMAEVRFVAPNERTHPAFGEVLREAVAAGVRVSAHCCMVEPGSLVLAGEVPMVL